jgi:hypothetical protein
MTRMQAMIAPLGTGRAVLTGKRGNAAPRMPTVDGTVRVGAVASRTA